MYAAASARPLRRSKSAGAGRVRAWGGGAGREWPRVLGALLVVLGDEDLEAGEAVLARMREKRKTESSRLSALDRQGAADKEKEVENSSGNGESE